MAGLNHTIGEVVEGMDDLFAVVPFAKYAEQTRLTAIVDEVTGSKFKRKVKRERPIVEVAMRHAKEAFEKEGLPKGATIDIIVQEYPRTACLCFIFHTRINGQDKFVTAPFKLGDEQIKDLTLRGLWTPFRVN